MSESVINQRFVPKVYDYYVIRGNTAVLRCHLPTSVKSTFRSNRGSQTTTMFSGRQIPEVSDYRQLNSGT
ncbi:hypothetical protein CEXT_383791 [Caerostris extrusa]|uniref:Uncharacterized protein n=1 Tax=Caerostris extrusa TaxID=172846 RepID=A0AAV4RQJ6_CAEEX|nr:hypothetical protein CEXT_383791 [Caerostris extrusa]